MKNVRRIQLEVVALRNRYGSQNIVVSPKLSWVKIVGFPLKQGMYNLNATTIAIIIPPHFDSESVSECYVDSDLRFSNKKSLPHMWGSVHEQEGYIWLCFHQPGKKGYVLLDFIETLRAYFSDPNKYIKANGGH